ncbi:MAG: PadR family transcriptional regulator [Actinomycetota bacterium]|nr:PadR family transcriptional regulator [Actinomycetota bacterium]
MADHVEGEPGPPRALLTPCLLLLLAESPDHGYKLMERLKPLGFDWNGPGPIYRELRALEAAKLVTSAWSPPKAGPVPRVYELTSAGREALERSAAGIAELRNLTAEYLGRYRKVATLSSGSSPERRGSKQKAVRRRHPLGAGR